MNICLTKESWAPFTFRGHRPFLDFLWNDLEVLKSTKKAFFDIKIILPLMKILYYINFYLNMQTRAQILSVGGKGATGWGIPLLYFSGWTCLEKSHGGKDSLNRTCLSHLNWQNYLLISIILFNVSSSFKIFQISEGGWGRGEQVNCFIEDWKIQKYDLF